MNLNIFQFMKQGTSLNRKTLKCNQTLETEMKPTQRIPNHQFSSTGIFNNSDSSDQEQFYSKDKEKLQKQLKQKKQKIAQIRHKLSIKVEGIDCPEICTNFTKMIKKYKIKKNLIQGLQDMGFHRPTPVQAQVIPCLMQNRNLIVTAPTGTGKTLAFLFPLLAKYERTIKIWAIIMAPMRQLALQIMEQLTILTKYMPQIKCQCISEMNQKQKKYLQNHKSPRINILITTPLAFLYEFQNNGKLLKQVKYIILDECDKYFQKQFFEQLQQFILFFKQNTPIYALFSATIQHPIEQLLKNQFLEDCLKIEIGGKNRVLQKIEQQIQYCTNQHGKLVYLSNMIFEGKFIPPVLIFVQQKTRAKQLYYELNKLLKQSIHGCSKVQVLSGSKTKNERQQIIHKFNKGKYWALITTDILSRGMDFKKVNLVINYDFPNSVLSYIHRVGRTGRADQKGQAITLFTDQDKMQVRSLANLLKISNCKTPEWIFKLPKGDKKWLNKRKKMPVKRLPVGVATLKDPKLDFQLEKMEQRNRKKMERQKKTGPKKQWIQVQK